MSACCREVAHVGEQFLFAESAFELADNTWDYASNHFSHHIRQIDWEGERTMQQRPGLRANASAPGESRKRWLGTTTIRNSAAFELKTPANSFGQGITLQLAMMLKLIYPIPGE